MNTLLLRHANAEHSTDKLILHNTKAKADGKKKKYCLYSATYIAE